MSNTVVLIHGAWLTTACWDRFRARYERTGCTVVVPPWPFVDRPIALLRREPHPDFALLSTTAIVDHYDRVIRALPEPPLIIGHSFGGLFAELLLDRGLGAAGVAIEPAPIRGIIPRPRSILSSLPVYLTPLAWRRVLTMSYASFALNFAETLPEEARPLAYDRHIVPAPGRLYFECALGIGTGIRRGNPARAPLLLIAGERDRMIVPAMVAAAYRKERRAPSPTAFMSFPGRSHVIFAERGWQEVADAALDWARKHAWSGRSRGNGDGAR
jgi:pimeloyl-ACP methyl ester carboxylesterase